MNIVEEYVKLNDAISKLENQASALREDLLRGGNGLWSQQYEVVVRRKIEHVLKKDSLPPEILDDPRFWDVAQRDQIAVRPLSDGPAYLPPDASVQVDLLRYRC